MDFHIMEYLGDHELNFSIAPFKAGFESNEISCLRPYFRVQTSNPLDNGRYRPEVGSSDTMCMIYVGFYLQILLSI